MLFVIFQINKELKQKIGKIIINSYKNNAFKWFNSYEIFNELSLNLRFNNLIFFNEFNNLRYFVKYY